MLFPAPLANSMLLVKNTAVWGTRRLSPGLGGGGNDHELNLWGVPWCQQGASSLACKVSEKIICAVVLSADKQHFFNFLPLPQVQSSFLEFDNSYSLGWQLETKSSGADVLAKKWWRYFEGVTGMALSSRCQVSQESFEGALDGFLISNG